MHLFKNIKHKIIVIFIILISSCDGLITEKDKINKRSDVMNQENSCLDGDVKKRSIYNYNIPFTSKIAESLKSKKYQLDFGDWKEGFLYKDMEVSVFLSEGDCRKQNIEKLKSDIEVVYYFDSDFGDDHTYVKGKYVNVLRSDLHVKSKKTSYFTYLSLFNEDMIFFAKCRIDIGNERNEVNEVFIESLICSFKSSIPSYR